MLNSNHFFIRKIKDLKFIEIYLKIKPNLYNHRNQYQKLIQNQI